MSAASSTRHAGSELDGTNPRWVVVERKCQAWRTPRYDQEPTDTSDGDRAVVSQLARLAIRLRDEEEGARASRGLAELGTWAGAVGAAVHAAGRHQRGP